MKTIKEGNLLKKVTKNAIIVHGCNAQGVMGGGFALQVKELYPEAYTMYRRCLLEYAFPSAALNDVYFHLEKDDLVIANAITQVHFGNDKRHVNYEAIAQCFEKVARMSKETGLPIHYPMIGAGLAGGNWQIISTIIDETLLGLSHTLWIYK